MTATRSKKPRALVRAAAARRVLGRARGKEALFPAAPPIAELPRGYAGVLRKIKAQIVDARLSTTLAANSAMLALYWDIGHIIQGRQQKEGWGAKVIDRLSADLRRAYPDMSGFSSRNLKYMRDFAAAWTERPIVQQAAAQLPWGHHIRLLDAFRDHESRRWYAEQAVKHGWSRAVLGIQIERRLHKRTGRALSNFKTTLPPASSDLATQVFKDPYLFDFLGTADPRREREVEDSLVAHLERFLLELGAGFAFVGRQVALEIDDQTYKVDLLFYHLKLRSFVVVELKAVPFEPGFVGQLNMYLSAVDDLLKHRDDQPTIGLLLCRSKSELVVEYALRHLDRPMGVAGWESQLVAKLPKNFEGSLPTIAQIEAELARASGRPSERARTRKSRRRR